MSYRCGLGPGLGNTPPMVMCDGEGCLEKVVIREDRRPPAWFLDRKPPPKWKGHRTETDAGMIRVDYCPACRAGADKPAKGASKP